MDTVVLRVQRESRTDTDSGIDGVNKEGRTETDYDSE